MCYNFEIKYFSLLVMVDLIHSGVPWVCKLKCLQWPDRWQTDRYESALYKLIRNRRVCGELEKNILYLKAFRYKIKTKCPLLMYHIYEQKQSCRIKVACFCFGSEILHQTTPCLRDVKFSFTIYCLSSIMHFSWQTTESFFF